MIRICLAGLALCLAGCNADPNARWSVLSCRDAVSGKLFTLDTRKLYDRVTVIGGENYASFRMPDGRELRVTETWALQNCKIVQSSG